MFPLRAATLTLAVAVAIPAFPAAPATAAATAAAAHSPAAAAVEQGVVITAKTRAERRQIRRNLRRSVVGVALSRQGAQYVWGGSGPEEFDCSGLVMWAYQQIGLVLPHYSGAQMELARPVPPERKLRRGDLLFYGPGGSQHVAIYIGKGMQVGANNPRTGIVVEPMSSSYWAERYVGAGRVIR